MTSASIQTTYIYILYFFHGALSQSYAQINETPFVWHDAFCYFTWLAMSFLVFMYLSYVLTPLLSTNKNFTPFSTSNIHFLFTRHIYKARGQETISVKFSPTHTLVKRTCMTFSLWKKEGLFIKQAYIASFSYIPSYITFFL